MNETRSNRFQRLATYRTNKVLDKIRILGNLANRSNYEYSSEEVGKIFSTIEEELKHIKAKFHSSRKQIFSL